MLLTDKQRKFYITLMIILLIPAALLILSDVSIGLNDTSARPLRGAKNNRISTSLKTTQNMNLAILTEGNDGDQVQYKAMKRELFSAGYSTLTVDFSGQGRSWGSRSLFDISNQLWIKDLNLLEKSLLEKYETLTSEHLHYIGQGEGAGALLEAAAKGEINPNELILIAPFINKAPKDSIELSMLKSSPLPFNVTIIQLAGDPVCSKEYALELKNQIQALNPIVDRVTIKTLPGYFHSYTMTSPKIIKAVLDTLDSQNPIEGERIPSFYPHLRIFSIFLAIFSLFLLPFLILYKIREKSMACPFNRSDIFLQAFSWIAGLTIATGIGAVIWFLPIAKPLTIIFFPIIIGSTGLVKTLVYHYGPEKWGFRPVIENLSQFKSTALNRSDRIEALRTGGIIAALWISILVLTTRLGLFYTIPMNAKQLWLWVLIGFAFPGFYTASIEVLYYGKNHRLGHLMAPFRWILFLIIPFTFLFSSGMTAFSHQISHVILLSIVLIMGRLMLRLKVSPVQTAFSQALVYILILLPQSGMYTI